MLPVTVLASQHQTVTVAELQLHDWFYVFRIDFSSPSFYTW